MLHRVCQYLFSQKVMAKKKIETLQDLFERAGSSSHIAVALGLHAFTVENWRRNGVPHKYWDPIMEKYNVSAAELHIVGKACRAHTYGNKK